MSLLARSSVIQKSQFQPKSKQMEGQQQEFWQGSHCSFHAAFHKLSLNGPREPEANSPKGAFLSLARSEGSPNPVRVVRRSVRGGMAQFVDRISKFRKCALARGFAARALRRGHRGIPEPPTACSKCDAGLFDHCRDRRICPCPRSEVGDPIWTLCVHGSNRPGSFQFVAGGDAS